MNRKTTIYVLGLLAILTSGACGIETTENQPANGDQTETVGTQSSAVDIAGANATWTFVENRDNANKITFCRDGTTSTKVYSFNDDRTLWRADGASWTYVGNPWGAKDIACNQGVLWALNDDNSLYVNYSQGSDNGWIYRGWVPDAIDLGGDGPVVTKSNGSVWGISDLGNGVNLSHLGDYTGITAVAYPGLVYANRYYIVYNGDIYFNHGDVPGLTSLPLGTSLFHRKLRDIAAHTGDEVWALSERRSGLGGPIPRQIWKLKFVEAVCNDGIDNDRDGASDGSDGDCDQVLGQQVCAMFNQTGTFCIARTGIWSVGLATCNGSSLVKTENPTSTGSCIQVGAGGSDWVTHY